MRGVFRWLRKTLVTFVQITYGRTINRYVTERCGMVRYGTVRYSIVRNDIIKYVIAQYGTARYGTILYRTLLYDTVRYWTVRFSIEWYGTVQYGTVRYVMVRYGTIRYDTVRRIKIRHDTTAHSTNIEYIFFFTSTVNKNTVHPMVNGYRNFLMPATPDETLGVLPTLLLTIPISSTYTKAWEKLL